jgi:sugar phosphate isomerase/epimerase
MYESMHKFMKVGLIHWMSFPHPEYAKGLGPIDETIRKIVTDDYFDAIEIPWIKDPAMRAKVKRMIEQSHMTLGYGGQPRMLSVGGNINSLDEAKRLEHLASLKEGIDEAYEMGAVGFAFLSGKYEEATKEQSYQALVKSTKELCAYAKSKGCIRVLHEVFDYDIDKKSLVGPVSLAKRYAEEICAEFDNFGLMVDLSHIPMIHESLEENLLPIKDYICHAHMGNTVIRDASCEAYGDTHPRFGFPNGENDVDELVEYLRMLLRIGFLNEKTRPIVSFEVKPWGDEDPEIIVANCKRVLNLAWARV